MGADHEWSQQESFAAHLKERPFLERGFHLWQKSVLMGYTRSDDFGNVKKCAVGKHPKSEKLGGAGQAAVCACAHSRYFAGGSPSGLRV